MMNNEGATVGVCINFLGRKTGKNFLFFNLAFAIVHSSIRAWFDLLHYEFTFLHCHLDRNALLAANIMETFCALYDYS